MTHQTKGPVMVITGTSKGIGRETAKYFAAKGYQVAGCSRGPATLKVKGYHHAQVDVGDSHQVRAWVRKIKNEFGRIDVLVCNAGLAQLAFSGILMAVTPDDVLNDCLRTHVAGTYYVCREVAKVMLSRKYGRIITVSSMGLPLHAEGTSAYSATKSAVVEMTKILAKELASAGITCNTFAPSLFMTEAAKDMGQEWAGRLVEKLTIKRAVSVEEVCNVISFFAAPESACITGQVINMGVVS